MSSGESGSPGRSAGAPGIGVGETPFDSAGGRESGREPADQAASVIVTEVSPFQCLYQDALEFHSQCRLMLPKSEGASSRLARAALLLYVSSAEALVHQAAVELARHDLAGLVADPARPLPLADAWRLLPALIGTSGAGLGDPNSAPWPQFAELLALRASWTYPGVPANRRAYYRSPRPGADFEPLQPHQLAAGLGLAPDALHHPRTGLPRDPYALRPHHLDTTRGVLDAAIEALDRRVEGALTRDNRHRREPTRHWPTPVG